MLRVLVSFSTALLSCTAAAQPSIDLRILRRHELVPMLGRTSGYAFGDVDGDGRMDLHISRRPPGNNALVIACPAGGYIVFGNQPDVQEPSDDSELVDVDGDGDLDIVAVSDDSPAGCRVLLNDGRGTFRRGAPLEGVACGHVVAVGDVDGRNGPDLFIGQDAAGSHVLLVNDGTGVFRKSAGSLPPLPNGIQGAVLADLDGDGDLDLAVAQLDHASAVLLNDGTGTFAVQGPACFTSDVLPSSSVVAGDLDGDGDIDLVFGGCERSGLPRQSRIMRNLGGGCFLQEVLDMVDEDVRAAAIGDLDGDGDLDVAFGGADALGGPVSPLVLANDGTGLFKRTPWSGRPVVASALGVMDADEDGDLELWVGLQDRDHWYAGHERQLDAPLNPQYGQPYRLVLTAQAAQTTPTTAVLLLGSEFLDPRLPIGFGTLRVRPDVALPLTVPSTGELTLETPWNGPGTMLFQALLLPNHGFVGARLTNVVGDTL